MTKVISADCNKCGIELHEHIGFVPSRLITGQHTGTWVTGLMCKNCGNIQPKDITEEQVQDAAERILRRMDANDLVTDDMKETLNTFAE
jgi:uncharacterized Zn finger protein